MRILFFGDTAHTGFGTVTMDLGRAMLERGEDLRFVSQNALGDLPEPFKSRTFQPDDVRPWVDGRLKFGDLFNGTLWEDGWKPEACIVLGDVYATRRLVFTSEDTEAAFRSVPTFHYVPIEGIGLPPSFRRLWQTITPVAMSRFGADQIEGLMGVRPAMVYHGVDTATFHPATPATPIRLGTEIVRSREDAKRHFGWQDYTVMLRVDSHWPRKDYGGLISALRPVVESHPDALLAMHCRLTDSWLNDDIRDHISWYSPGAQRRVGTTGLHDKGYSLGRAELAVMYNAADLYVSTSAEGFGLTIAESLACGVPVLGIDYSSVPEVIGPAGVTVPAYPVRNEYAHFWAHVDERAFGEAAADLLEHPKRRERLGARGPAHIRANFSWICAADEFAPIIAKALPSEVAA